VAQEGRLYIGGEWIAPSAGDGIDVVSPHIEEVIARAPAAGPHDVDRAVAAARAAIDEGPWPRLDPSERIDAVRRLAAAYGERRRDMAQLITAEMGAPITFSKLAQVGLPGAMLGALADVAARHTWEEAPPGLFGHLGGAGAVSTTQSALREGTR
jgi:acyl-CoA reductase-like NAD-dependent aldehyde dehydrogenase